MLILKLDEYDFRISPESCQKIIELLPRGKSEVFYYCLDDSRPKYGKKYKKPFFKFFYKGKGYQVAAKRFNDLIEACQAGIADVPSLPLPTFMIGMRVISAQATSCSVLRFDDDGEARSEEVG